MIVKIFEIIGSDVCVFEAQGQKICDRIFFALKWDNNIILDFYNINIVNSSFLQSAIGQLYGVFDEEQIKALIGIKNMNNNDKALLKTVVENAKVYFKNKKLSKNC